MSSHTSADQPTGPENPRGPAGPDAPAPPGGPQRVDQPGGSPTHRTADDDTPGGASEPTAPPTPAAPQPMPDAPDGEVHARSQAEQAAEELQEENAETSLDQPSS